MKKPCFALLSLGSVIMCAAFLLPKMSLAAGVREPMVKVSDPKTLQATGEFLAFDKSFQGGGTVAVDDVNGDGRPEIVVGAGPGGSPRVNIFLTDGTLIKSFLAYGASYTGGVEVAAGDLNGDGTAEIIAGTGAGGGPQVKIFNASGQDMFTPGFFAFDKNYHGGIHVAACDFDGNGTSEIVVGSGNDSDPHVRVFDRFGTAQALDFRPFSNQDRGGVSVSCLNADGGRTEELITAIHFYGVAHVKVYRGNSERTIIGDFIAFPESYRGGINVAGGDLDGDGLDEVIVSASQNGGPQVLAFEAYGKPLGVNYFAYEYTFRGGVNVAAGDTLGLDGPDSIITMPGSQVAEGRTDYRKYIEIDLSDQRLKYFENGIKVGEHQISSGKPGMDTPTGTFKIFNKQTVAYSNKYKLYMPSWMQFTAQGHGLHGLPYWKMKNGGLYYEGANHLGRKVSHGCVRSSIADAAKLWNWAENGTTVIVHQ
ncbi:MAG: L,D-transpeptidase family protein [Patescibacteria group bacterium]|jgi:hypothetical protein